MKNFYLITVALLIILMLTLPLLGLAEQKEKTTPAPTPIVTAADKVKLLNTKSGETTELSVHDYLFGVVAAEISLSSEPETVKAQAVASYTYLLYKKGKNSGQNYDITDDSSVDQAYLSLDAVKEKWGDNATAYEQKLNECLSAVEGLYICYDNAPIFAAYHAISSGKTESCESVWGNKLPYLVETESLGDLLSPNYLSEKKITAEEFKTAFGALCTLPDNANDYIGEITRSASGGVKTIKVGDKVFSGGDFRKILSLRSANFDVNFTDATFNFTVRGYGHGVGLSQNGAEYMAKQGNTYTEILAWYYKNCSLVKSN